MSIVLAALLPIAALIALGYGIRARNWLDESFWAAAERLIFRLLLPALLVSSLSRINVQELPLAGIAATLGGAVLALAAALLAARPWLAGPPFRLDGPAFTSLFQGSLRVNTYVGLAVGGGVWGREGLALVALSTAVVVALTNLISVPVLLRWGHSPDGGARPFRTGEAARGIIGNPLILSCLLGLGLNLSGVLLPKPMIALLDILGSASLPLALMAVGAGLQFSALRRAGPATTLAVAIKMGGMPLLVGLIAKGLGLSGVALAVMVAYAALPASPISYVMARQMGGDAPLVSTILTAQVVAAALLIPLWIALTGVLF